MAGNNRNSKLNADGTFQNSITLNRVHRDKGIYLNRQWYGVDSLASMILHDYPRQPKVPHSRRPMTRAEIAEIAARRSNRSVPWPNAAAPAAPRPELELYIRRSMPSGYKVYRIYQYSVETPRNTSAPSLAVEQFLTPPDAAWLWRPVGDAASRESWHEKVLINTRSTIDWLLAPYDFDNRSRIVSYLLQGRGEGLRWARMPGGYKRSDKRSFHEALVAGFSRVVDQESLDQVVRYFTTVR